ncbi:DUF2071 domain-containing protein [Haladaptatus sp. DYF46]|uniref:YqjF family protein n=1 Tax=Haladaptatus sp. DYF46 TaxID=2886041 RepID=UPI001E534F81|nr:DUF2071 domain-containing protein [Haladaptatus sp. DYF46]
MRALRFTWRDCLFVHWPVGTAPLENAIPDSLALHTYDGRAWVSVLASTIENARLPGAPRALGMTFPQVNFRTYVRLGDATGVYFLSLDTASRLVTRVARRLYHLPYFHADISIETDGTDETSNAERTRRVRSHRFHPETLPVEFEATYRPNATATVPEPGSLADFLAERYRLFVPQAEMTARVEHDPWTLHPAEADVRAGSLFDAVGLSVPDAEPRVRYCPEMEFHVHAPKRLD